MRPSFFRHFLLCCFLVLLSCGESEDPDPSISDPDPTNPTDGAPNGQQNYQDEIHRFQIIPVTYFGMALTKSEYTGKLGDIDIILRRDKENTLIFQVPSEIEFGIQSLTIPELGAYTITYLVKEQENQVSPSQSLSDLNKVLEDFQSFELAGDPDDDQQIKSIINDFQLQIEKASESDQAKLAAYYSANKVLFDGLILNDYDKQEFAGIDQYYDFSEGEEGIWGQPFINSSHGRIQSSEGESMLTRHRIAVLAFGIGVATAWLAVDPLTKTTGALIAIISWRKAKGYFFNFIDAKLFLYQLQIGELTSELNNNRLLDLPSGKIQSISSTPLAPYETYYFDLNLTGRGIIEADRNKNYLNNNRFFDTHDYFAEIVENLNELIDQVNEFNPFTDISNISTPPVPVQPQTGSIPISDKFIENFKYEYLGSGYWEVDKFEINTSGQLVLRFSIPYGSPIKGSNLLNFSYFDEFISFYSSIQFEYDNCSNVDKKLSEGHTVKDLVMLNYPLDCLYGKPYGGGLLLDYDPESKSWIIISSSNLSNSSSWGEAISIANNYKGGAFTDWTLDWNYFKKPVYSLATRRISGFSATYWNSGSLTKLETEDEEAESSVYAQDGGASSREISKRYSVRVFRQFID